MTRVKKEKAGGLYGKIKNTAHIVPTRRRNIGKKAAKKAPSTRQGITKRGKKRRQGGISAAKKKTAFSILKKSLDLVEKLGDLRERGMLSEKEFQAKKKEILEGNRKNTRAFGASRKVPKRQRGVNYANQRFQNGGVSLR